MMDPPARNAVDGPPNATESDLEREVEAAVSGLTAEEMAGAGADGGAQDETLEAGSLVRGRVANVGSSDVLIDLGGKMLGVIPRMEFAEAPVLAQEVEALVEGTDPRGGLLLLSRKKAAQAAVWRDVQVGMVFEGTVTGMNRGGLEVDINGVRGFIPASQADTHFRRDISELIGSKVWAEVTKLDRAEQNLVLSRRKVMEREAEENRARLLAELSEGQTRRGVVRNVTDYGAFVELSPGVDGLIHVSDMSWGRVQKASDVVSVGQELDVHVMKVNRETGKISLGLKQIRANPWDSVGQRYAPQQRVKGRVVRLADFGAFVELEEGIDGLIPVSEMSWTRRIRHPKEMVKEGDIVEVVVLSVDAAKHRISLGLRQLEPNPWENIAERYPPDRVFPAKVARLADFGAFVEIEPGIDGLLHISEISEERVRAVSDKLAPGQEVQVRVIKIDVENHRVSLSMKPPPSPGDARAEPPAGQRAPRKPSKPRRGGLEMDWIGGGLGSLDPSKYA